VGGGYEHTDPDYAENRLARMRAEYAALTDPQWKQTYLRGLTIIERRLLTRREP
jgi:hypothetical protein